MGPEEFHEKYPEYEMVGAQNYSARQSMISKFEGLWDSRLIIPEVGSDSHAEHLFIGLSEALPDVNIMYFIDDGFPTISNPQFV